MDILILAGALALVVIAIVIAVVGFQMGYILRDVSRITGRIDHVTDRMEDYILKPFDIIEKYLDMKVIKKFLERLLK